MIRLIQGDCNIKLKDLANEGLKVDCIITDPPYNISKKNNFHTLFRQGIDFGEWDKGADIFSYIEQLPCISNKNASLIIFNDWKNLGDIVKVAESNGYETKDLIRLEKSNPMPRNRDRRYIVDYEFAIWFVMPNAQWTFNRQDAKFERPKYVAPVQNSKYHPTQKDLGLMKWLVKVHTNIGDIVLDPFMGSGTTGVACQNLGRNFIGIEKDDNYFGVATKRLDTTDNLFH